MPRDKMIRKPQSYLHLFTIMVLLPFPLAALELPYEVLDTIEELSDLDRDFKDLTRINVSDDRGPTRPIYRLDLDQDYVAYYEIDMGKEYVVLSSGHKTGDFRKAESGPDPRPTDVLIRQAQDNDQRCERFYRLSPLGLTICKDDNGAVVAASYNWMGDVAEINDWRQLDQMVEQSLDDFKSQWQERAEDKRSKLDWATTEVFPKGRGKEKEEIDEEALSPGSIIKLALGERFRSADLYVTNIGNSYMRPSSRPTWQQKLCTVLVDVCLPNGGTRVNPFAVKKERNELLYLRLEVHGNWTFVKKVLQGHEIGFVVEIKEGSSEVIKKHFVINLHSKRIRRSVVGGGILTADEAGVFNEEDFPDYDQHECCGDCHSGCSPVAWAQVFGYYDRRASKYPGSNFSPRIYGNSSKVAPLTMEDEVKPFVEDIRLWVQTYCDADGVGLTDASKMHLIAPWFEARQGYTARVVSFLAPGNGANTYDARVYHLNTPFILQRATEYLKLGFPVILSFILDAGGGHSAVATKYKITSRNYRECLQGQWYLDCSWITTYDYEFFLHYGWGGSNNKWQQISPLAAHVAYVI